MKPCIKRAKRPVIVVTVIVVFDRGYWRICGRCRLETDQQDQQTTTNASTGRRMKMSVTCLRFASALRRSGGDGR
jgi:hypothetical protein